MAGMLFQLLQHQNHRGSPLTSSASLPEPQLQVIPGLPFYIRKLKGKDLKRQHAHARQESFRLTLPSPSLPSLLLHPLATAPSPPWALSSEVYDWGWQEVCNLEAPSSGWPCTKNVPHPQYQC